MNNITMVVVATSILVIVGFIIYGYVKTDYDDNLNLLIMFLVGVIFWVIMIISIFREYKYKISKRLN